VIRAATINDLAAIMEFAEPVWNEIQPGFPVHRGQSAATLRALINSDLGLVAVLDDDAIFGMIVGACSPSLWAQGMSAVSYLRWVTPERRGRWGHVMTRYFEAWAKDCGAKVVGLSQTGRDARAYYERLGYSEAEMMYFKAI